MSANPFKPFDSLSAARLAVGDFAEQLLTSVQLDPETAKKVTDAREDAAQVQAMLIVMDKLIVELISDVSEKDRRDALFNSIKSPTKVRDLLTVVAKKFPEAKAKIIEDSLDGFIEAAREGVDKRNGLAEKYPAVPPYGAIFSRLFDDRELAQNVLLIQAGLRTRNLLNDQSINYPTPRVNDNDPQELKDASEQLAALIKARNTDDFPSTAEQKKAYIEASDKAINAGLDGLDKNYPEASSSLRASIFAPEGIVTSFKKAAVEFANNHKIISGIGVGFLTGTAIRTVLPATILNGFLPILAVSAVTGATVGGVMAYARVNKDDTLTPEAKRGMIMKGIEYGALSGVVGGALFQGLAWGFSEYIAPRLSDFYSQSIAPNLSSVTSTQATVPQADPVIVPDSSPDAGNIMPTETIHIPSNSEFDNFNDAMNGIDKGSSINDTEAFQRYNAMEADLAAANPPNEVITPEVIVPESIPVVDTPIIPESIPVVDAAVTTAPTEAVVASITPAIDPATGMHYMSGYGPHGFVENISAAQFIENFDAGIAYNPSTMNYEALLKDLGFVNVPDCGVNGESLPSILKTLSEHPRYSGPIAGTVFINGHEVVATTTASPATFTWSSMGVGQGVVEAPPYRFAPAASVITDCIGNCPNNTINDAASSVRDLSNVAAPTIYGNSISFDSVIKQNPNLVNSSATLVDLGFSCPPPSTNVGENSFALYLKVLGENRNYSGPLGDSIFKDGTEILRNGMTVNKTLSCMYQTYSPA